MSPYRVPGERGEEEQISLAWGLITLTNNPYRVIFFEHPKDRIKAGVVSVVLIVSFLVLMLCMQLFVPKS